MWQRPYQNKHVVKVHLTYIIYEATEYIDAHNPFEEIRRWHKTYEASSPFINVSPSVMKAECNFKTQTIELYCTYKDRVGWIDRVKFWIIVECLGVR